MSSVSMLSDYSAQINPQGNARPSYEVMLARKKEYNELKNSACLRKVATKVMGAICCPISNACGIFLGIGSFFCCVYRPLHCCTDEQDESGTAYCPCTTCESPCWALPLPRDRCDMVKRIFDMCICCVCYSDGRPEMYLLPEERQRYTSLAPDAKRQIIEDSGSFPSDLTEMVISFDPLDIPTTQVDSYRAPIVTPPSVKSDRPPLNRGDWWMP